MQTWGGFLTADIVKLTLPLPAAGLRLWPELEGRLFAEVQEPEVREVSPSLEQVKITASAFKFIFAKEPAKVSGCNSYTHPGSKEQELIPQHKDDHL